MIDDRSSAVSLPEVPLLGVLPGTGGLTRLTDKRKVRRDLADVFCTTSEGVRGKKAVEWRLVDAVAPRSRFAAAVRERARALADQAAADLRAARGSDAVPGPGITLGPVAPAFEGSTVRYEHVTLTLKPEARRAELLVRGPRGDQPRTAEQIQSAGDAQWSLRAFREIDDALLRLRLEHLDIGLLVVRTEGDLDAVLAADEALHAAQGHWLAREIVALQARVLRRLDLSSRSVFALVDKGSCFAGALLELALAADRIYMLADDDGEVAIAVSSANGGALPMSHGLSRLAARFYGEPARAERALAAKGRKLPTEEAEAMGLVTFAPDEIDWEDDVRIALEERASLSPDALTGMEASLRFPGAENCDSKIFARLSAWQNWIFQRPNAVGPQGALTKYGQPDRPAFDWRRC
jgi:benzoyl-CoA-dihydrodiol lyase